jgi:predicted  nucleic acid-binding Zn-ribbon protein
VGALINSYTTIKGALIAAKAAQIQMNLATLANPYVAAAAALAVLTLAMLNYKTETELAAEAKAKFDAQLEGKSLEDKYNIVQTELNKTIKQRAVVTDLLAAEQERLRKGTVALSAGAAAATAAEKPLTVEYAKQIEALDRRRDELAKQAQGIRNEIKESKRQTQATNENTTATNKNTTARETALDVFKRETAAYMAQQKAIEDLNAEMNDTLLTLRDLGEGPSVAEALLGKAPEAPFMMNLMDLEMQDELIPEEAIEGADRYVAAFMRARNAAVEFNYAVSQAVEQAAESMAYNFGEMLGTAMATGDGMQGLGRMVLGTLADLAVQVGKIAIGVGISVEGIKKALQSLNPVLAVAAGIALVALGSYARTRLSQSAGGGVPAFAQGGLVTGPTLAMVGDNRSGKEAIIPFERMGEFLQMAGAGQSNANVTVTGRLQGRDLVISNERTTFNRNRTKY